MTHAVPMLLVLAGDFVVVMGGYALACMFWKAPGATKRAGVPVALAGWLAGIMVLVGVAKAGLRPEPWILIAILVVVPLAILVAFARAEPRAP